MPESASFVERLRSERQQAMGEKKLTLEIPGYHGLLFVEYQPIPWDDMTRLIENAGETPQKGLNANIDALLAACKRLLVVEDGERKSFADTLRSAGETIQGEVLFNNGYAAEALSLGDAEEQGARATVLAIFGGAVSPELAISEHATRIMNWMRGVSGKVDEELVGK